MGFTAQHGIVAMGTSVLMYLILLVSIASLCLSVGSGSVQKMRIISSLVEIVNEILPDKH